MSGFTKDELRIIAVCCFAAKHRERDEMNKLRTNSPAWEVHRRRGLEYNELGEKAMRLEAKAQ